MRILVVSQYFWPEYFRVNDLALELKKKNNDVDVLTSYPNYPQGEIYPEFKKKKENYSKFKNINIYRVPQIPRKSGSNFSLFINYLSFLISGIILGPFLLRKKKYDVIITFATSPIIVAIISILLSKIKKAKHIIWVLDLWPQVLVDLDIIKKNSFSYNFLKKIVILIYRFSDLVLCQSLAFKREIRKLDFKLSKKLIYFPSWPENTESKLENIIRINDSFDPDYKNILFAGNIGESQNFDKVLSMMDSIRDKKVKLNILGQGRNLDQIKKIIFEKKLNNVILHGYKKFNDIQFFFKQADYLLISLKYKEAFNATIPGKFQTYLNYRKPIIGLIGGEVYRIINKYKIGVVFNDEDMQSINKKLDLLFSNKVEINELNYNKLLKIFSKERNINKLNLIINNLCKEQKIQLIKDLSEVNINKNFIISGLNLAFLGYLSKGSYIVSKHTILWPDGFFKRKFFPTSISKIPGREFLSSMKINSVNIKKIFILGTLPLKSKNFLIKKFNTEIVHINLPQGKLINFINLIPVFREDEICITTLPTPKQEILANYVAETQKFFKIICLGGAINMASGEEKPVPKFFTKYFIGETIWRLQFDPVRRITRLLESLLYYIYGELFNKFDKIKIIVKVKNNE
jgi:glycosyltransferase involved in cell wall biosynthesis